MNVNPKIILRNEMRKKIQEQLMWIDLEDKKKKIMHIILDKHGKSSGTKQIVLPAFYLYIKTIGHGNGEQSINTFAYEIRTAPNNALILKKSLQNFND